MRQILRRLQIRRAERSSLKDVTEQPTPDLNFLEHGSLSLGRLPTEIVLDILEFILSEDPRPVTRTILRLVSKAWCNLFGINGYPTLWACASIPIPGEIERMQGCIEYCHKFILHSGNSHLDIILDYQHTNAGTPRTFFLAFDDRTRLTSCVEQLEPMLDVPLYANPILLPLILLRGPVGKLMHRWRSLTINNVKAEELYQDFIFPHISYPAPNLTLMTYQHDGSVDRTSGGFDMNLRLNCPNLHRLRLHTTARRLLVQESVRLNLRHLELSRCTAQIFAFALLCQNLETLSLESTSAATLMHYPASKFPRLRKLSVMGRLIYYHPIWRGICFPALEHVRLWCADISNGTEDISYNLNQLSIVLFREGSLSPNFPELQEVFLDLPKPNKSMLLDLAGPAIDKTQFAREALIYLTKIHSLATEVEAKCKVYQGSTKDALST